MIYAQAFYNARLLDESMDNSGAILCVQGKIRTVFQGFFTTQKTVHGLVDSILEEDGIQAENCNLEFIDLNGKTLTPAFIDMHVHLRDPGLTQKEDLNSGLHACAAGGYGTVVAMPNTNPVISTKEQAMEVMERGNHIGQTKVYQSVSITAGFGGTDTSGLESLDRSIVPVITEDGHDVESTSVMLDGMIKAGKKGIIVACHCEDCTLAIRAKPHRAKALEIMRKYSLPAWGGQSRDLDNVPEEAIREIDSELTQANEILALAENLATDRNIQIARQAGCHIHLCHVSTAQAIQSIRNAKLELANEAADFYADMADAAYDTNIDGKFFKPIPPAENGFTVTCEVTPHHIALTGTEEPDIRALVNPPLRSEDDRLVVLDAIRDGTVDVLSTDHAPHTSEDKANGAPGFTGIEAAFGVYNTILVHQGQISASRLSQLMSANPARILHLKKGVLKPGFDADFTITDPEEKWFVNSKDFKSKGKATPFEGRELCGKVKATYLGGKKVF